MVLDKLSQVVKKTTDRIANAVLFDKGLVDGVVRDLQRALIEADVNIALVKEISEKIKKEAVDERLKGVEKREHIVKLLHDELIRILGKKRDLVLGKNNTFLFVGLYGAGKTTTIGKMAAYYSKRGYNVCAVGLDVHRPAAPEQLRQTCEKVKIECFIDKDEKDPLNIWKKHEKEIKKHNLILVDSAGRDALDDELIKEIKGIVKAVKASETLLVMQADIGQAAKKQAQAFKDAAGVSGVIITRMDSTAKAGGALTACAEVGAPVVFIGTGETPADLETFDPESFLSRMLGMGDLKGLMEKIHSTMSEKDLARQQKKMQEGKFTLRDVAEQAGAMEGMGMDKIMGMIPGMGKVKDKIADGAMENQQNKVKRWKHIVSSMTEEEVENPLVLEKQTSRIQRVAHGSGCTTTEVRLLIKQWKMLSEMMKSQKDLAGGQMDQKTLMKLARKFGRKARF